MQLEYKIIFETPTNDLRKNRDYNHFIIERLKNLLMNYVFNGEVELLTNLRTQSPHSLETYHELEQEL